MEHPPSNARESNPRTRSPHKMIVGQPEWIQGGELRDFQITGLNFMAFNWSKNQSCVLADEMGLGKTVQTVAFMNFVRFSLIIFASFATDSVISSNTAVVSKDRS